MSSSEPFGPWVEAMERAGAVDPRNGNASWNQLAERAGVSTTAITNMATGKTKARPETVQKVADALRVRPEVISGWIGAPVSVGSPYIPVTEAALLSKRERDALDLLIRAIARGREEGEGRAEQPAPKTSAGRAPAQGGHVVADNEVKTSSTEPRTAPSPASESGRRG